MAPTPRNTESMRFPFFALAAVPLALFARTARADTLLGAAADTFELTTVATGLERATDFRFLPDGRVVLTELGGRVLLRNADGTLVEAGTVTAVLPRANDETGLFAVEVHPDFAKNRTLYLYYARADAAGGSELDRDRLVTMVLRDDDTLDLASERVVLDGLQSPGMHQGGGLAVGPDRKVYLAVGDAGCLSGRWVSEVSTPTNYFPTCLTNAQGKILRVDLDGSVPADNPLVGLTSVTACGATCGVSPTGLGAPREAIWAWGFRNPFRMWIDPRTGTPWVGDVGELSYEEITLAQRGRHHGWPWREGKHGHPLDTCAATVPGAACVDPVYECQHGGSGPDTGCVAITGGGIVDDCTWPKTYRGRYVFADSGSALLSTLRPNAARDGVVEGSREDLAVIEGWPIAVRPGDAGDLYVLTHFGRLLRLSPKDRVACDSTTLSPEAPSTSSAGESVLLAATPTAAEEPVVTATPELATGGGCAYGGVATSPGLLTAVALLALLRRRAS